MARLRDAFRIGSAVILSIGLSATSYGAPAAAFGTVTFAESAHVGRVAASVGTTVFSGDYLDTEKLGGLQVRAGAARLLLSGSSRVLWGAEENAPAATLTAGTATFSTANSKAFALRVATAVIRPTGEQPTIGSVRVVNPKELTVNCSRGSLTLTVLDDALVIPEGTAYHIVLDANANHAADNPKTLGPNPRPKKRGRNRFIFFLIAFATGVTAFAVLEALVSPASP
jgi:hypothetical protein